MNSRITNTRVALEIMRGITACAGPREDYESRKLLSL